MIFFSIIIIGTIGTLLHFVYEWSHHNKYVAMIAAVNESTWEHIKIGMTPTIVYGIYYGLKNGFGDNFIFSESLCLLTIILLIPILFYSYTIVTKKSVLWIDVVCFFATIVCSQTVFYYFITIDKLPIIYTIIGCILFIMEFGAYLYLTLNPMKNFIFKDPITHKYGLKGHPCHHHHKQ